MAKSRWAKRFIFSSLILFSLLAVAIGGGIKATKIAKAAPYCVTAVPSPKPSCVGGTSYYYHSWYVSQNSIPFMQSLAKYDASWASNNCSGSYTSNLTILDFGSINAQNGTYGVYSKYFGFISNSTIQSLVEAYADQWYTSSSSCPHVYLGIGTSNYAECKSSTGSCSETTAGTDWDSLVHNIQSYINGKGYLWQVIPQVADDVETEWDSYNTASGFLNGVANQEKTYSNNVWNIDYGTADMGGGSCGTWSAQDIYYAAWSIGWDVAVPETYFDGNGNNKCYSLVPPWNTVEHAYPNLEAWGAMAECSGNDPLPSGSSSRCNSGSEYTPDSGKNAISSWVDANYSWETNIQVCVKGNPCNP